MELIPIFWAFVKDVVCLSTSLNLKLEIHGDSQNRKKLSDLLRYPSTESGDELTSFNEYVTKMKEGQNTSTTLLSMTALENSPFLEKLQKKGYEVLFVVDDWMLFDEFVVKQMKESDGRSSHQQGIRGIIPATGNAWEAQTYKGLPNTHPIVYVSVK
ncbi:LOW QUALITY PROTEIN: hypothetical protein RJ639_016189 [Escallonia herrerae]|uniref:Uncharacterized protein n=1 Tax=Escallonia herrerae TaxID=1293975 RepID=A0AA88VE88_9ASTE|nr:LOW QUALITY PROTEIN: hypothetical protein RJ639_016189 [Escallonia herrerae]